MISSSLIHAEGVQHPSAKTWMLRGLIALAVIGICALLAIVGWIAYIRIRIEAGLGSVTALKLYWNEKIMSNLPMLVGGILVGGAVGMGSYWGYRKLQRKVVEEAKEPIIRLLSKGDITEEEAAEKLGIGKPELKGLIEELKEEEVIE